MSANRLRATTSEWTGLRSLLQLVPKQLLVTQAAAAAGLCCMSHPEVSSLAIWTSQ
jgi:hypothetical protein